MAENGCLPEGDTLNPLVSHILSLSANDCVAKRRGLVLTPKSSDSERITGFWYVIASENWKTCFLSSCQYGRVECGRGMEMV